MPCDFVYVDRVSENFAVCFSPAQKWNYLSAQSTDELLAFVQFDSKMAPNVGRSIISYSDAVSYKLTYLPGTIHSSFSNPLASADVPLRESIEVAAVAYF